MAVEAYSATSRGFRCADSTRTSNVMARSSSSLQAASICSRSASLGITMPTCGPSASSSSQTGCTSGNGVGAGPAGCASDTDRLPDIGPQVHALDADHADPQVGHVAHLGDIG